MKIDAIKTSRFMKKEDVGEGLLLTIDKVVMENVGPISEGAQDEDSKPCVYFKQKGVKPLVLNVTNFATISSIAKQEDTDNWGGTNVVVYFDPNIWFSGKQTGGLRVRQPSKKDGVVKIQEAIAKKIEEVPEAGENDGAGPVQDKTSW